MLLRLIRLSERARTLFASIPAYKSLIYIVVAQLVEQHYAAYNSGIGRGGVPWSKGLHQLLVVFLMEISVHQSLCVELNSTIPESVVISQIPVFSGTSTDLLFVALSQLLIDDKPRTQGRVKPEPQPADNNTPEPAEEGQGQPRPDPRTAAASTSNSSPFLPNYIAVMRNM